MLAIAAVVLLGIIALATLSGAGALAKIAEYLRLLVPGAADTTYVPQVGDEIWIRSFGQDRQCVVRLVDDDGAVLVEPMG